MLRMTSLTLMQELKNAKETITAIKNFSLRKKMPKQNSPLLIPHTKLPTRHSLTSMRNLSLDKKKQMLEPFKRRELEFSTWLRVTSNLSLELLNRWIKELIISKAY